MKELVFVSENPPLKSKGSGISVLLYNMAQALKVRYQLSVITFSRDGTAGADEIRDDNQGIRVTIADRLCRRLYRRVRRDRARELIEFVAFLIGLPALYARFNRSDKAFITVVGASIQPVVKAWFLMLLLPRARHGLYVVDDLETINKINRNVHELELTARFLERTIKRAGFLLTISEGLRQRYLEAYAKDSTVLLPHYQRIRKLEPSSDVPPRGTFKFLFTGGLNLLYNDALRTFAAALAELNRGPDRSTTYQLIVQTYSALSEFQALQLDPSCTVYSTSRDRSSLVQVYAECDCFVVPYSFNDDNRSIVATSFPQKLAEIVQYGKKILVFAPDNSSIARFFVQRRLAYTCGENSIAALMRIIARLAAAPGPPDGYDAAYDECLSAENVAKVIDGALGRDGPRHV